MRSSFLSNLTKQIPHRQGSLARVIILTLVLFSFIPLSIMAATAYWRAQTLLRDQAVSQMKSLVSAQMFTVQNQIKIKQIRLDRIVRRADFAAAVQTLLHQTPDSPFFQDSSKIINDSFDELNRDGANPIFTQFMILDPDGNVLLSSKTEWMGQNIKNNPFFAAIRASDSETFSAYDFTPFFSGEFTIFTVSQYRTMDGVSRATVVGISEQQTAISILKSLEALSPDASKVYFVTDQGEYIGLENYTNGLQPFDPSSGRAAISQALASLKFGNASDPGPVTVEFKNSEGLSTIAQVAWVKELNAGLVMEIPSSTVLGKLSTLLPFTIIVYIILFLAIGLVAVGITSQITNPILALADSTSKFAQGDLQERVQMKRNDEIGLLASSFNSMADELSRLYTSLREQVDERTRQIRTAAEVAQGITTSFELNDLLQKTVELIVERFGFYHAGVFLIDETGKSASLRAAFGPSAAEMLKRGTRHPVGSASIVGWVSANKKPRVASDVELDPIHSRNELLPATRAEAGIPVLLGGVLLGVLDVQSTEPATFDEEMIIVLQTLANQIGAAIQNATASATDLPTSAGAERIYRASFGIVQAASEEEVIEIAGRAIKEARHPYLIVKPGPANSQVVGLSNPFHDVHEELPFAVAVNAREIQRQISGPVLVNDLSRNDSLPAEIARLMQANGWQSGLALPVQINGQIAYLILIGEIPGQPLSSGNVRPFASIPDLMGATLTRIHALEESRKRMEELEALGSINRAIVSTSNIQNFFSTLQEQITRAIGNYSFLVALYDGRSNSIQIPYLYEDGKVDSIETFPLGEGLTSILIRTRRPLLLVEDTERQAQALGAKIQGKPAKSWLGVPMLIGDEPIGALVIQDVDRENSFDEQDLNFMVEVSRQVAGLINNIRLLEESRRTAIQLQTAAEIARDISSSLNLDELLLRAVNLISERFHIYHASVFLVDLRGEFAVVREATGEAGAQLKRMGHKLGVGSKSIVGYVTGRGEPLVVNDTMKDATYFANPLLPDTRAECAIPLKVGERVLGALDVQSITPYAFTEDNLRTLEILADQLAVAVVNTELFADSQEHLSQHRLLHHITTSAASGTTLEEALETAVKGLQVTLGGDRVAILMADRDERKLVVRASVGYSEQTGNITIPFDQGVTGWVATHRRPLRVDDVTNDPRYIEVSSNTRSEMAIPLLYRNELLGVMNVESEQAGAYTENDEEMLGTLAGSLAAIIANARLLDQIRKQADRERLLFEVTSKIRRSTDIQTILATTASELTRAVGARGAQIKLGLDQIRDPNGRDDQ